MDNIIKEYWSLISWFIIAFIIIVFFIWPKNRKYFSKLKSENEIPAFELEEMQDYFEYVPNLWISLGIFGTFFGLVVGLSSLKLDTNEDVYKQIPKLLSSMYTAFISSLVGIIFSGFAKNKYSKYLKIIFEKLVHTNNKEQESIVQGLVEVKNEVAKISQNPFTEIADVLKQEVQNYIKGLNEATKPIIDSFTANFYSLNDVIKNSANLLENSFNIIKQYKSNLDDEWEKLKMQFVQLENSAKSLNEINEKLSNYIGQNNNNIKEIYQSIVDTKNHLSDLNNITSNSISLFNDIVKTIQVLPQSIDNSINSILENLQKLPQNIDTMFNSSSSTLNRFADEYQNKLNVYLESINNTISTSLISFNNYMQNVNNINLLIERTLKDVEKEGEIISFTVSNKLKESFDEFDKYTSLLFENFNEIINKFNIIIQKFIEKIGMTTGIDDSTIETFDFKKDENSSNFKETMNNDNNDNNNFTEKVIVSEDNNLESEGKYNE